MTDKEKSALQKQILDFVGSSESGRLLLSPRSGKTKMIINIIKRDKPKSVLWVTPTSELAEKDIPSEFIKWRAKGYLKRLTTITWKSLEKCEGEYDLIVGDEEQFITELNSQNLFNGKLKYKRLLFMTGTESRRVEKKELYKRLNLKILYSLSINTAVDIGLLANYNLNVVRIDLNQYANIKVKYIDKRTSKEREFMTSEENQYKYISRKYDKNPTKKNALARLQFIKNSSSKLGATKYIFHSLEGRKILFASNKEQTSKVTPYIYHSETDNKYLKMFIDGKIDNIAMVNKGGVGYTYRDVDNLIISQIDSDNQGLTSQKISRTLLHQGDDYKAVIWVLILKNTQEEVWLESLLKNFNKEKINYIEFKDLVL